MWQWLRSVWLDCHYSCKILKRQTSLPFSLVFPDALKQLQKVKVTWLRCFTCVNWQGEFLWAGETEHERVVTHLSALRQKVKATLGFTGSALTRHTFTALQGQGSEEWGTIRASLWNVSYQGRLQTVRLSGLGSVCPTLSLGSRFAAIIEKPVQIFCPSSLWVTNIVWHLHCASAPF